MGEKEQLFYRWGEVTVPDMAATDLTRLVVETLGIERVHDDYRRWNSDLDANGADISVRGRTFSCLLWTSDRSTSSRAIRNAFQRRHASAYVGAFHALLLREPGLVNVACLPERSACLQNGRGGSFAPCLMEDSNLSRTLFARWTAPSWNDDDPLLHPRKYTLVAFRPA